ncbi:YeaH/YhbH family protein [Roseomonas marmotae]|uniref:UPF0229 protein IAI60_01815 n=1 Tax=Roseomonas marmotae TaxID=2768161 RepID=A0ABS3KAF5_9PROT|nr:YeaH/YhbH family protein [Roseomonas marmotae]MBO1073341.1 YeaH/YhbH family protein [Roseomonas marmotae]QTI79045.1 YeaH/YhbH family protein [Roseomonas marmotae]
MNIVDRRPNPKGKILSDRQRFLQRAREQVRKAVADSIASRRVADIGSSDSKDQVKVRSSGTAEPFLRHGPGGRRDIVVPGNERFVPGDRIPSSGGAGGRGNRASDSGEGQDAFEFALTRAEFLDIFFGDLELPELVRREIGDMSEPRPRRAGISVSGAPTSLNLTRTMRNSMGRRVALHRPGPSAMNALQEAVDRAVESGDPEEISKAREALQAAARRAAAVPFIDPVDLRYNRFEPSPHPRTQAVMFCLMDVSGSMTEHMKDLAKRFFMLLHLFLERKYEKVAVVFIRHTEKAQEVDEETFFRGRETGGTVVSSALDEMLRIATARYPASAWNIYAAQASDGDNYGSDNARTVALMRDSVLPMVQYFAYIETRDGLGIGRESDLWSAYHEIGTDGAGRRLARRQVTAPGEIWGVFADLFRRGSTQASEAAR